MLNSAFWEHEAYRRQPHAWCHSPCPCHLSQCHLAPPCSLQHLPSLCCLPHRWTLLMRQSVLHKFILCTRMKFWYRFLILGSAIFMIGTLYYYMLLDGSLEASHDRRRALESHLSSSYLKNLFKSFSMELDPEVCSMKPHHQAHRHGNISTLDVFQETSFNLQTDGMYELASPPPDYPK